MYELSYFSARTILIVLLIAIVFMPKGTWAFGAGNIPSLAAIEGSNFRHGDIEDTLVTLAMASGSFFSKISGGKKFNNLAIKRVYFGNWLRDYSQAIDVGTLSKKINPEMIRVILWIMAFSEFGYGTEEFEVTSERLGVYRAEEHIDNPKGYAEGEDARTYDSRLRGPVDPQELEIDHQTGMKNYICNERGNWPTSSEYVRTSLQKCIQKGRLARNGGTDLDQYEAFRLLGQALHTLEDFSAHSNYCELVLISLGHSNVFPHVGRNCKINLRGQQVYPIVTGTFGGQDFIHSLMGGAQDSLSQVEIGDVQEQLSNGVNSSDSGEKLKQLFGMVPVDFTDDGSSNTSRGFGGGSSRRYNNIGDEIDALRSSASGTTTDPQELIAKIYPLFQFRDRVMKKIEVFIDSIPLLSKLKEKISDTITLYIMGIIQPVISPILTDMVDGLHSGTEMIVNDDEQFRVWNDPSYDNPTHSQLSKDHFASYLNEPAGKIATEVVAFVVPLVVKAWEDSDMDVDEVTSQALQVFHHPSLASTPFQAKMKETVQQWVNGLSNRDKIIQGLSADGVRNGMNLKTGGKTGAGGTSGSHTHKDGCGHDMGFKIPRPTNDDPVSGFNKLNLNEGGAAAGGYNQYQKQSTYSSGGYNSQQEVNVSHSTYNQASTYNSSGSNYQKHQSNDNYGSNSDRYGSNANASSGYGHEQPHTSPGYGNQQSNSSSGYGNQKSKYSNDNSGPNSYNRPTKNDSSDDEKYSKKNSDYSKNSYKKDSSDDEKYSSKNKYKSHSKKDSDSSDDKPNRNNRKSDNSSGNTYGSQNHSSSGQYSSAGSNAASGYGQNASYGDNQYGSSHNQPSYNGDEYGNQHGNRYNQHDTGYSGGYQEPGYGQSGQHEQGGFFGGGAPPPGPPPGAFSGPPSGPPPGHSRFQQGGYEGDHQGGYQGGHNQDGYQGGYQQGQQHGYQGGYDGGYQGRY